MDGDRADRDQEWPYRGLDVAALQATGWRPTPFHQFIVKLHSRCNLSCSYCYVFSMEDTTWRTAPKVMSSAVLTTVAGRMADHVVTHGLTSVDVVFHGGEPLLVGAAALDHAAATMRTAVPPGCELRLSVQTNGLLLDDAMLAVLHRHDIRVGVSLDGPADVNDRRRVFADGRGSHALVARTLRTLGSSEHSRLFAGILCTIDVRSDPVRTYESLAEFRPPSIDFLLPHGNWSAPPPFRDADSADAPFGEWLAAAYDRWSGGDPPHTRVRLFEQILNGVLGGQSTSESIGLSPAGMVVVDTGGSMEQVDSLRSVRHGAAATGLSVHTDPFDAALADPGVIARQIGTRALHETCQRCPLVDVCGAGYYPHRYRTGSGFRNPSVYCRDLTHLIRHVAGHVSGALAVAP